MEAYENDKESAHYEKIKRTSIGPKLEAKMNKIYKPGLRYDEVFQGKDITFITNENGEPITLYVGKRKENGNIVGDCFYRRIKKRVEGKIKESHWDLQGKTTGNHPNP